MASEYTANFDLDKYVGTDKPNLRDQYNAAMDKIDAQFLVETNKDAELSNQIYTVSSNLSDVDASVTTIKDDLTAAEGDIDALQSSMSAAEGDIDALQSSMTSAEGDISALTATVETHGDQITAAAKTADDALSLAQTNEGDISTLDSEMSAVQADVKTANASIDALTDTYTSQHAALLASLEPSKTTFSSGSFSGSFCVNEGVHLCTLRITVTDYTPESIGGSIYMGFTVPEEYRPTVRLSVLLDVNSNGGQVTNVVVLGTDHATEPGELRLTQNGTSVVGITQSAIITWFYGFTD